jgi:hypothetical protein
LVACWKGCLAEMIADVHDTNFSGRTQPKPSKLSPWRQLRRRERLSAMR